MTSGNTTTVRNAKPVASTTVFALVEVTLEIGGVDFGIMSIQARCEAEGQTSIRLPTFKDGKGIWRPAVWLPHEMHQPICDTVLAFLVDERLTRHRYAS